MWQIKCLWSSGSFGLYVVERKQWVLNVKLLHLFGYDTRFSCMCLPAVISFLSGLKSFERECLGGL